jgi:hypothetical protein
MRIEELSVGDWVCAKLAKWENEDADMTPPLQVKRINGIERHNLYVDLFNPSNNTIEHSAFVEDLIPIPLTSEILEKNGFVYVGGGFFSYDTVDLFYEDGKFYFVREAGYDKLLKVEHVHQLQHALRLAGIEKDIEV